MAGKKTLLMLNPPDAAPASGMSANLHVRERPACVRVSAGITNKELTSLVSFAFTLTIFELCICESPLEDRGSEQVTCGTLEEVQVVLLVKPVAY